MSDWDQKTERRKNPDRRGNTRPGKYDRRRNRCGMCVHFILRPEETDGGYCKYHDGAIGPEDFACPVFDSV